MLRYIILSLSLLLVMGSCQEGKAPQQESTKTAPKRIVSLNGTLTELLYELGYGDQIVGVDVTSTYPKEAQSKTNLGHSRQLNAEAILALEPTLIVVDEQGSQSPAIGVLKESGIEVAVITVPRTLDGSITAARDLEKLMGVAFDTQALENKIAANKKAIADLLDTHPERPKVLFIYARGAQTMMVAGTNTFADDMIRLAGGVPAVEGMDGFKPLTPEALLQSQPEVVLMFDSGLESLAEEKAQKTAQEQLFATPGMEQVPAAVNKRLITLEGLYLSGFGPRASDAALELAKKLHP